MDKFFGCNEVIFNNIESQDVSSFNERHRMIFTFVFVGEFILKAENVRYFLIFEGR